MKPENKKVLLYSGGLDCYLIYKIFLEKNNDTDLLYIKHNNSYEDEEILRILLDEDYSVIIDKSLNLKQFEKEDKIIDNRNLLFCIIAANYGYDEIYIGSVLGDNSRDQNEPFFSDASRLLSNLNNRHIKITPLAKHLTKSNLVKMYLEMGGSASRILDSYSCYSGHDTPCGICKPCVRKWVALETNNIDTSEYFENNPLESEYFKEPNLTVIKNLQWRGVQEDSEILDILRKKKYIL